MQDSGGSSGRILLLVAVLFAVCYFADWTDDYNSYYNATRYASFATANGQKAPVSGGSMFPKTLAAAFQMRGGATAQHNDSALEAVFGTPVGLPQSDADDVQGRSNGNISDAFANGMSGGTNARGAIGSRMGISNSTFGQTGYSGTSGFGSGTSAASMSAWPQ